MKLTLIAALLVAASLGACNNSSSDSAPTASQTPAAGAPGASPSVAATPAGPAATAPAVNSEPATKIVKGVVASIDYTLTDPEGKVLDSSKGREPLSYLQGYGNIVPGLEKALEGKAKGETLKVTIPPEEGYGKRTEDLIRTLPKAQFQGAEEIKPGMQFRSPAGVVTVTKVETDKVTIDANHPLAGIALTFDVTVKDLRNATAEELSHGHFHGAGTH